MTNFERDLCVMVEQGYRLRNTNFPLKGIEDILVSETPLPNKAINWSYNNEIRTLGELIDRLPDMILTRGMGEKTLKNTKNAILNFAYDHMSEVNRNAFWKAILV